MEIRVSSKSGGRGYKGGVWGGRVWGRGGAGGLGGRGGGWEGWCGLLSHILASLCSLWDSAGFVCLEYRPLLLSALLGQPLILDSQAICLGDAGQSLVTLVEQSWDFCQIYQESEVSFCCH